MYIATVLFFIWPTAGVNSKNEYVIREIQAKDINYYCIAKFSSQKAALLNSVLRKLHCPIHFWESCIVKFTSEKAALLN